MNPDDQQSWRDARLDDLLTAFADDDDVRDLLVFRGARILHQHLGTITRRSYDLDSALREHPSADLDDRTTFISELEATLTRAIERYCSRQRPVRLSLSSLRIKPNPRQVTGNIQWQGYRATIALRDRQLSDVLHLPTLQLDIAAPESLTDRSTLEMKLGASSFLAYTLERCCAEKLRALLDSLSKDPIRTATRPARIKDLYDLNKVTEQHPTNNDSAFWPVVFAEYKVACDSRGLDPDRLVDIASRQRFARSAWQADTAIPSDRSFAELWQSLERIAGLWRGWR